ncbi:MAG TPA: hypothetical protein VIM33_02770 [Gaiellaceae bacterium]
MNALHRLHSALVPGGLVLDMQPVGPAPPVESNGQPLGALDMREWRVTIDYVAALVDETIAKGLFAEEAERRYEILETFDDGKELVETVREWTGTTISQTLAARVERAMPPLTIQESVQLRALRAL